MWPYLEGKMIGMNMPQKRIKIEERKQAKLKNIIDRTKKDKFAEGTKYDFMFPDLKNLDIQVEHIVTSAKMVRALERGTNIDELMVILKTSKSKCVMYLKLFDLYVHPIESILNKKTRRKTYKFRQDEFFHGL